MKYDTIIFDFDGTIADTQDVMRDAMNALAREFGFVPIAQEETPTLKTMSARVLLTERLGIPLWNVWKIRRLEKRGREEFDTRAGAITVIKGMPEVIALLHTRGVRVGILSSNAPSIVSAVAQGASMQIDFVEAGSCVFGKARALRKVLRRYTLDRSRVLYIGDELRDLEACKKVSVDMLAVGWGFNDAEALHKAGLTVARDPLELSELLLSSL